MKNETNEEIQRMNNAIDELQKIIQKSINPEKSIEIKPISDRPEDIAVSYFTKSCYEKDLAKQIEYLSKAIEINPEYADAYNNRGIAYTHLKEYEKAIEDFSKAIEINQEDADTYYNRGIAYSNLKEYEKVIEDYNKAIEINPEYAEAYNNRGNAYSELKEYAKAIEDFNKAIEINPEHTKAYYNRGTAYSILEQYGIGIKDLSKAIEINSEYVGAYNNRGYTYLYIGQYEKAYDDIRKAQSLAPDEPQYLDSMGEILTKLERYAEAIIYHDKAIAIDDKEAAFYYNRAICLKFLNRKETALDDCNTALAKETCNDELKEKILQLQKELKEMS